MELCFYIYLSYRAILGVKLKSCLWEYPGNERDIKKCPNSFGDKIEGITIA